MRNIGESIDDSLTLGLTIELKYQSIKDFFVVKESYVFWGFF